MHRLRQGGDLEVVLRVEFGARQAAGQGEDEGLVDVHGGIVANGMDDGQLVGMSPGFGDG